MQEIDRTTPSAVAFYGGMCIGVVLAHLALDNTELAVFKESIEKSITGLLMDQHINGADIEDQIERSGRGVEVFANGTRPWIESAEGVTISPRRRLGYNFICAHVIAVLSENLSIQERHIITGQLTVGERASMEMEAEVLSRDAGPLYVYDIVPGAQ
jgi:hypothetical protein